MNYGDMIKMVRRLDFIRNDQRANAAVKAVLGNLAGCLDQEQARNLADKFPEHLDLDAVRSDGKGTAALSVAAYTAGIGLQFKISHHQARALVRNVLYFTKETSGANGMLDIMKGLPNDWAAAIQNA